MYHQHLELFSLSATKAFCSEHFGKSVSDYVHSDCIAVNRKLITLRFVLGYWFSANSIAFALAFAFECNVRLNQTDYLMWLN